MGAAADNHRLYGVGRRCDTERYIHEAEERNKIKKIDLIQSEFNLIFFEKIKIKIYFFLFYVLSSAS